MRLTKLTSSNKENTKKQTELIAQQGSMIQELAERIESIRTGYRPTVWCHEGVINTTVYNVIQKVAPHDYHREILETQDGGELALDWANIASNEQKMVVLVLPGLTGSSRANYSTHLVEKAVKLGCKAVVMNYRGVEIELKTPRAHSATNYEDLDLVVKHVHNKFKDHKILAVGISLGGIKLGGYMAEQCGHCLISYALIVSAPLNINISNSNIERPRYLLFNRYLARERKKYIFAHKHWFENDEKYDFEAISKARTLKHIDVQFFCKNFDLPSVEIYHNEASIDGKIRNIRTPTIFLNADDDIFSPKRAFPIEQIKANPFTALVHTKYGGHISFCEGLIPTGCNYVCRVLTDYLKSVLDQSTDLKPETPNSKFNEENLEKIDLVI